MKPAEPQARPTYILSYPRPWRLARTALIVVLIGAALAQWLLAWVRFLGPILPVAGQGGDLLDALAAQPIRPLLSAHMSLFLVAWSLNVLYALLPDLSLADHGLMVHTFMGWKMIPWTSVTAVRTAVMPSSGRTLLVVQGQWTRWGLSARLASACVGAGFAPGVLMNSDLRDFGPLVERMRREISLAAPLALWDDEFPALPARVILEPSSTLAEVTAQAHQEGWPIILSAQAMAAVTGGLVLAHVLLLALVGGTWWKPLIVIGLCGLEWLIGALYLYALTEVFTGRMELGQAALLYPLTQIPRALLAIPMSMLIAAGAPFLGAMLGLIGVLWAVLLTTLLVQQAFRLTSILPALPGGGLQAIYLFLVLAIVFSG